MYVRASVNVWMCALIIVQILMYALPLRLILFSSVFVFHLVNELLDLCERLLIQTFIYVICDM